MTSLPALPASNRSETAGINLLQPLFASATRDASVAMCRWTNSRIRLTLDEVREIPLENVCGELGITDELLTMVVLNLEDDIGGTLILTFDEAAGRRLAALLTGESSDPARPWNELDRSALTETGNILGCAYVSVITRLIDQSLMPAAPHFIQDYGASVLEQAMMVQAVATDRVLICRTGFYQENRQLSWLLLFIPTPALRAAMEKALEETT